MKLSVSASGLMGEKKKTMRTPDRPFSMRNFDDQELKIQSVCLTSLHFPINYSSTEQLQLLRPTCI